MQLSIILPDRTTMSLTDKVCGEVFSGFFISLPLAGMERRESILQAWASTVQNAHSVSQRMKGEENLVDIFRQLFEPAKV